MGDSSDLKKVLFVFGTRPEAIKMAPIIIAFKASSHFETKVCITAQHREMLDQVLNFFDIIPDYDLDLMQENQNLYNLTGRVLNALKTPLEDYKPHLVFVHGDTTTTMAASLAAFYAGSKVGHIEAGLRTFNKLAPFPEEMNRQITGRLADFHFAPTGISKANLRAENIDEDTIFVTGNSVIDALHTTVESLNKQAPKFTGPLLDSTKKNILITGHRRENLNGGLRRTCEVLKIIALNRTDVNLIYPVHLNPKVQKVVYEVLGGISNVFLIAPLSYPDFVWIMYNSYLIITDSGGVQEEAPGLGKPVLVTRETTERPEAVEAGTVLLVGTDPKKMMTAILNLLDDTNLYNKMSQAHNPYGDGKTAQRILKIIKERL